MVVLSTNPVHSVLWLILTFFGASGLFILLGAEFLALILMIVYVGAVAVLFMFVVMMLNINFKEINNNLIQFDQFNDDIFESYQWDFGDNSPYSNDFEPIHDFPGPGEYFVTLTVEDQYGCVNESTLIVYIYPSLYIYSPSVFTPNNDDHNNVFRVSVVGSEEFELIIYDRWGKEVFRTRDEYEGWDGNYKNGKPAEQAVYTYKVIVHNGNTGQKIQSGKVTLAR